MKFSRQPFFAGYREIFGRLDQEQIDGLEFLLGKIESDPTWGSVPEIAYFLATIDHETSHTFQPIKEKRERANSPRRANQDRYWLSGFYGRGYIQLTWKDNYKKFGLVSTPDRALERETSYMVATRGMQQGLFRPGHKLGDYVNGQTTDYVNARNVVNGKLDKADLIAGNARSFEAILNKSLEQAVSTVSTPTAATSTQEPEPPAAPQAPKPDVTPIGKPETSTTTKVASGTAVVTGITSFLTAIGLKIGNVEITTGALYALLGFASICVLTGAWLWNEAQKRRTQEQRVSMDNLADPNRGNVIAAGSKV